MSPVFADTSFYGALLNPRDAWHAAAVDLSRSVQQRVVLTEFVLLELGNALSPVASRRLFTNFVRHLRADRRVTIVPISKALFDRGYALYSRRADKSWSLTDCISFVVMETRRIEEALTADHHFAQACFTVLLK